MEDDVFIFDCEVYSFDWLFVFKQILTGQRYVYHNDPEGMKIFMENNPLLCGFNNKHYDDHILKAVLVGLSPEEIKEINDAIIIGGVNGWEIPVLREQRIYFDSFDLMDDCQIGLSLKAIEAHLGIPIEETAVDFNINRSLTEKELEDTIKYCSYDVDATERLYYLRTDYLKTKVTLGATRNIPARKALRMTNAKLTSVYLQASPPDEPYTDEREYRYPDKLLRQYIPKEVFSFFDRIHDTSVPSEDLWSSKLEIEVGGCPCTLAFGGIHGAIPTYSEDTGEV